jgi:hypothetical protein
MKREDRIRAYQVKQKDRPRLINLSDLAKEEREAKKWSSARRFIKLNSPDAIETITQATKLFQENRGLELSEISRTDEIPSMPHDKWFKYLKLLEESELYSYLKRNLHGENNIAVLVCEEGLLIAYGIAERREAGSFIKIIDVDRYSSRSADFKEAVEISGQNFEVGVGHVLALALIGACPKPIRVQATDSSSKYIFYSLGFLRDDKMGGDDMTME